MITIVWFVLTAVFIILEFVSTKYFLPIAMGAVVAGVASLFSLPILGQIIVCAVVVLLAYLLFNPNRSRKDARRSSESQISDKQAEYDEDLFA